MYTITTVTIVQRHFSIQNLENTTAAFPNIIGKGGKIGAHKTNHETSTISSIYLYKIFSLSII